MNVNTLLALFTVRTRNVPEAILGADCVIRFTIGLANIDYSRLLTGDNRISSAAKRFLVLANR